MKQKLNCVLLIDDDEPTNYMSTMLLEEAGCTEHIQVAESGEQALEFLDETAQAYSCGPYPELIFLDINMPAMNGWEFLARFKEVKSNQHAAPVIIMLTTSINPDDEARAAKMAIVDAFENKPLTFNMIERVINRHFADTGILK